MRGALGRGALGDGRAGIIPAYAGSTAPPRLCGCAPRDHPRVCGEHARRSTRCCTRPGSSPRMRGAPAGLCGRRERHGIIPAYAGSTVQKLVHRPFFRDHPRVCGEHGSRWECIMSWTGSSPRMRGALRRVVAAVVKIGIIPAYAGSTMGVLTKEIVRRDHPRVCGEHQVSSINVSIEVGSSPRMRGALRAMSIRRQSVGIIPAYAGSTFASEIIVPDPRDHPRVCGEHTSV